jgi:uncharacterized damage-inducible protein DinB
MAMGEAGILVRQLKDIHDGEPWHGPSLHNILAGIDAEAAYASPLNGAHSIWELMLHVTAWTTVCRLRLEGQEVRQPDEGDFPLPPSATQEAWRDAISRLDDAHARLITTVERLSDSDLAQDVPGKPYTKAFMIQGAVYHHIYHSGQIAILKKAIA